MTNQLFEGTYSIATCICGKELIVLAESGNNYRADGTDSRVCDQLVKAEWNAHALR